MQYLWIGLGGFLGANTRYLVQQWGTTITVTPETSLWEALSLLLRHRIKRLPVVDSAGQPVGLIGRGGIFQAIATGSFS